MIIMMMMGGWNGIALLEHPVVVVVVPYWGKATSQFSLPTTQNEYRNEINRNDVKHDRRS